MTTDDLIWKAREVVSWVQKHFLSLRGGTVTGPVTFKDDVTSTYLDSRYVNVTGDTMTGTLEVAPEIDNAPGMFVTVYDTSGAVATTPVVMRSARGTRAAPTAVKSGDVLGGIGIRGYGATGFSSGGRAVIVGFAAEDWTDAAQGTYIYFGVTPTGSASVAERMRLNNAGNLGIATDNPAGRVHINGITDDEQLVVEAHSTQTANLQEWRNSSGVVIAKITGAGGATFNDNGADADTVIEGDTDTDLIHVDASADKVGISEAAPNATLDVNGTARFGDSDTNYAEFSATGDLTLAGSAKYERHIQIDAKADGTVANQPAQVDFFTAGGLQYASVGAKYAYCQWEVPDDWDGTNVYFEIDWFPDSGATSGTDAVRWTVEYRSIAEGEAINNATSVTLDNGTGGDTADYSQYQTKHTRFTLVYNNANQPLTKQDHVYFKVSRDTSVANDFAGTVTITAYEIIYTSNGFPTSN